MSICRLIPLDGATPQRWRNGGGTTRELLAWPSAHSWRVRISVAEVESDGPFSTFAGAERWFAVLEGHGVELEVDRFRHRVTAAEPPLRFSGEAVTNCRLLDGPTRDLNLMLRGMRGGMFSAVAGQPWRSRAAHCGLFAAVAGQCIGDEAIAVGPRCLLWFDRAPAELHFAPAAADADPIGWWLAATPVEYKP